ncbi:MAG: glycosyltransferase family 4 protein [Candidatus Bathyarchaeota archaeon]|uniref:glycosyltransferase family 4 protein n=1 Tax=Candidatus Bathycorpusculum sp. TaxID=2994959 RepID=UPI00281F344B|nr:glycosyltransferase family 4 protein [Candidatus Termiticorpusculum sp.]
MKICVISGLAKFSGGLENVVDELNNFLITSGIEVNVFGRSSSDFVEFNHNCKIVGVRPYSFFPPNIGMPWKFEYNLKVWRKTRAFGSYDVIHGHGDNCFFSSLFRDKTPFMMTFHGTMAKALQNSIDPREKTLLCAEKVAADRCDVAVACSNAVKNELIHYYGLSYKKIKVIHNGVNVKKFVPIDKKVARQRLSLPDCGTTYALWVGSNPHRKGFLTAVKAVEQSRCSKLLIVGMTGRNSGKNVFLGKLSEQDLITAYSAADILVFPTVYEGFPMVPMEALACGLPVLVSEASNMGEIIQEGTHGFIVKDGTIAAYQKKIDTVINDSVTLKEMSVNCRNLALNYCWSKQAEKYLALYNWLSKKH